VEQSAAVEKQKTTDRKGLGQEKFFQDALLVMCFLQPDHSSQKHIAKLCTLMIQSPLYTPTIYEPNLQHIDLKSQHLNPLVPRCQAMKPKLPCTYT
jgi:hypothetical protein